MKKHYHVADAMAYLMSQPLGFAPAASREPIHGGTFFTLDHPHISGCDLNIRIGSATDDGDVEVRRADIEELHAALGKWLHDTTPMANTERREFSKWANTYDATFCVDCDQIVPFGQDYHQCPKRGKVRLR